MTKARGVKLGNPNGAAALRAIVAELNARQKRRRLGREQCAENAGED